MFVSVHAKQKYTLPFLVRRSPDLKTLGKRLHFEPTFAAISVARVTLLNLIYKETVIMA